VAGVGELGFVGELFFAVEGLRSKGVVALMRARVDGDHELAELGGVEVFDGAEALGEAEFVAGDGEDVGFASQVVGVFAEHVEVAAAEAGLGVLHFDGAADVVLEAAEFGEEGVEAGAAIDVGEGLEAGAFEEFFALEFGSGGVPILVGFGAGPFAPETELLGFGEEHGIYDLRFTIYARGRVDAVGLPKSNGSDILLSSLDTGESKPSTWVRALT
jgi:hypothetical protein